MRSISVSHPTIQGNLFIDTIDFGSSTPKLSGSINVSSCTNLKVLKCVNNSIGSVAGITTLTNLTSVDISQNLITGSIPNLPSGMVTFRCDVNRITGSIPALSSLSALQTFYCNSNQLTGAIPGLPANIRNFYCQNNSLGGSIPTLSGTQLRFFYCHSNQLTGIIPELPPSIQYLRVQDNSLTGSIPTSISTTTSLIDFQCQAQNGITKLTGSIPNLSSLSNLVTFRCDANQLTGSFPSITGATTLQILYCNNNQLTGNLPSTLPNSIREFYCQSNSFTGSLPNVSGASAMIRYYFNDNSISTLAGTWACSSTLAEVRGQNNSLTQTAVDGILLALVNANKTTGTRVVNLAGTGNAAPSSTGIGYKNTLISRGWTVTTN